MTKGEKAHVAFIAFVIVAAVSAAVAGLWWQAGIGLLLVVGQVFGFFGRRQARVHRGGEDSRSGPSAVDGSPGA